MRRRRYFLVAIAIDLILGVILRPEYVPDVTFIYANGALRNPDLIFGHTVLKLGPP